MAHMDVPKFIRRLRAGGISEDVAMAHAEAVTGLLDDGFATKSDLNGFAHDLLTEINHVRDTLRAEMKALEDRISAKLDTLRLELKADNQALENRMILKLGGLMAAGLTIQVAMLGIFLGLK